MLRSRLAVMCLFFIGASIQADDKDLILKTLKAEVLAAFGESSTQVSTSKEDEVEFQMEYQTRPFLVYNASMTGEWSKDASEVTGPSHQGMIVHVVLHKNSELENEQAARIKDSRGATIAAIDQEPYWERMIWVMPLDGKDLTARIYLSYGSRFKNSSVHQKLMSIFGRLR